MAPPGARGPKQLHRLHRLKAGPAYRYVYKALEVLKLKIFGTHCVKVCIWRRILQPEHRLSYRKQVQMTVKTVHNLFFNARELHCILLDA